MVWSQKKASLHFLFSFYSTFIYSWLVHAWKGDQVFRGFLNEFNTQGYSTCTFYSRRVKKIPMNGFLKWYNNCFNVIWNMHKVNNSWNCLVEQLLEQLVEKPNNCQHFLAKLRNKLTYHFFSISWRNFVFHNRFYYTLKWEPFHDILTFCSTHYERDFWKIWWKFHDVIIYLFMKRKGNIQWRSSDG